MYNRNSTPMITHCTFSNNSRDGMSNFDSEPTVIYCMFLGNSVGGKFIQQPHG
jgi:hypothetical protein